jgi:bacillithiol synthase
MNIAGSRHFSKLAQDYLTRFDDSPIRDFFTISPYERGNALKKLAEELVKRASVANAQSNRQIVVAELRKQYEATGIRSEAIEKNLDLLAKPTTLAVVTGQQVGILGGPLYTLYKALSAIALANELNELLNGYNVIPIFWQEADDHDLEEASHYGIIDQTGNFLDAAYEFGADDSRRQVGSLSLNASALQVLFNNLETSLQKTEFTEHAFTSYKAFYSEGRTFAEAQAKYLASLTSDLGLLIINANTHAIKSIGKDLFRKELKAPAELQQAVRAQTVKLVVSYHAQVDPSPINLFIIDDGKRYKIEHHDDIGFRYDAKQITADELNRIVDQASERISPNVVMRPLFQDTVLPTLAYVAGPGEIAYFTQLRSAYEWAGIPMPLIAPRFSATIIEDKVSKTVTKTGAEIEAFIEEGQKIINTLTASADETTIADQFDEVGKRIEAEIESLRPIVTQADGSLDGALTGLKGKLLAPLKDMRSKTLAAERKKSATLRTQLERSLTSILPGDTLQERKLGLLYYTNKYGPGFIDGLKETVLASTKSGEHQLLSISEILAAVELPSGKTR